MPDSRSLNADGHALPVHEKARRLAGQQEAKVLAKLQELAQVSSRNLMDGYLTMAFGAIVGGLIAAGHDITDLRKMLASAITAQVRTPERPPDG